jgi:hypothetical protein
MAPSRSQPSAFIATAATQRQEEIVAAIANRHNHVVIALSPDFWDHDRKPEFRGRHCLFRRGAFLGGSLGLRLSIVRAG